MTIWSIEGQLAIPVLIIFFTGLGLFIFATSLLDHFEFTGLRQAWENMRDVPSQRPQFHTPLLYQIVRHPLQLGIVTAIFAVPHMAGEGLLFATIMLTYIYIGLRFEKRALLREFGDAYSAYCKFVLMLFPRISFWSDGANQ